MFLTKKKNRIVKFIFCFYLSLVFTINALKVDKVLKIKEKVVTRFISFSRHSRVSMEATIFCKTLEPWNFQYFYHSYSPALNRMVSHFPISGKKWPQLHSIIAELLESNPTHTKKLGISFKSCIPIRSEKPKNRWVFSTSQFIFRWHWWYYW